MLCLIARSIYHKLTVEEMRDLPRMDVDTKCM